MYSSLSAVSLMLICGGEGKKNQYDHHFDSALVSSQSQKALNPRRIITSHNNVALLINNVSEMMETAFEEKPQCHQRIRFLNYLASAK